MIKGGNPVNNPGKRNVLCGQYRECLDYAVKKAWEYWHCAECPHRFNKESSPEMNCSSKDSVPHYDVSVKVLSDEV